MNRSHLAAAATLLCLGTASCAESADTPLIFGETNTLGITASGSAPEQAAELTLGYRSRDIAIIPVFTRDKNGNVVQILGGAPEGTDGAGTGLRETLSVLGQFDAAGSTSANTAGPQASANLGRFFATGSAAVNLSWGFRCKLTYEGAAVFASNGGTVAMPESGECP